MAVANPAKFHSDGKAVDVALTSSVLAGDVIYADGWLGIAATAGDSGDDVAIAIDAREYIFDVGASLSVSKGNTVYVTVTTLTGHLPTLSGWATSSGSNRIRLFRATTDKDANNLVHGILISREALS
jgi:predicted RecA/RadA family phage recombinase